MSSSQIEQLREKQGYKIRSRSLKEKVKCIKIKFVSKIENIRGDDDAAKEDSGLDEGVSNVLWLLIEIDFGREDLLAESSSCTYLLLAGTNNQFIEIYIWFLMLNYYYLYHFTRQYLRNAFSVSKSVHWEGMMAVMEELLGKFKHTRHSS